MRLTTFSTKQRYTTPSIELIQLGQALSILESNSIILSREEADKLWEVGELEDHGEL